MPQGDRAGQKAPGYVDRAVGVRLRMRRKEIGMSQAQLGEAIGLTFQQIGKYEGGASRIAVGVLFNCAAALNAPVSYFYQDLQIPAPMAGVAEPPSPFAPPPSAETARLMTAYASLSASARRDLLRLVETLAKNAPDPKASADAAATG